MGVPIPEGVMQAVEVLKKKSREEHASVHVKK